MALPLPAALAYVNGEFLPADDIRLPLSDRGFRLGDGLFETIRLVRGRPYQWHYHWQRLQRGLDALQFRRREGLDADHLAQAIHTLAEQNGHTAGLARLAVSRGSGSRGYLPTHDSPPGVYIETQPLTPAPPKVVLWLSHWRRSSPASLPTGLKLAQGANSLLARLEAEANGAFEALMLSTEHHLAEASSANLFWFAEGQWHTPALSTGALAGSTRHAVMRLTAVRECLAPLHSLRQAEAVAIANASWGLLPVCQLQPQGWQWKTGHPAFVELQALLVQDCEQSYV